METSLWTASKEMKIDLSRLFSPSPVRRRHLLRTADVIAASGTSLRRNSTQTFYGAVS